MRYWLFIALELKDRLIEGKIRNYQQLLAANQVTIGWLMERGDYGSPKAELVKMQQSYESVTLNLQLS